MKVFLLKTILFVLGFWILSNSLGRLADRLSPMKAYDKNQIEMVNSLLEQKDTIEAFSIGNSHSESIDFETLGMVGQRIARPGTDLFEIKLYLDSLVPELPKLETVFISISYFSFSDNNVFGEDTRNLRVASYYLLPTWTSLPGDREWLFLGKLHRYFRIMSIVRPDNWKGVLKVALGKESNVGNSPPYSVKTKTPWGECSHYTQSELDRIGYEFAYQEAKFNHPFDPKIQAQSSRVLEEVIEMLQNRGIKVILFTPPYNISYNNRFKEIAPEMIESMYSIVENIQAEYNIEYYNAASLPEFSTRPELFYNSDHVNVCGMKAFTEYLKKEMEIDIMNFASALGIGPFIFTLF